MPDRFAWPSGRNALPSLSVVAVVLCHVGAGRTISATSLHVQSTLPMNGTPLGPYKANRR